MTDAEKLIELMTKIVRKEIKELGAPYSPVKAKVVRSYMEGGHVYSDVIVLNADGSVEDSFNILRIKDYWLSVDTIVRIGFYYFDPSQPYMDRMHAGGDT